MVFLEPFNPLFTSGRGQCSSAKLSFLVHLFIWQPLSHTQIPLYEGLLGCEEFSHRQESLLTISEKMFYHRCLTGFLMCICYFWKMHLLSLLTTCKLPQVEETQEISL